MGNQPSFMVDAGFQVGWGRRGRRLVAWSIDYGLIFTAKVGHYHRSGRHCSWYAVSFFFPGIYTKKQGKMCGWDKNKQYIEKREKNMEALRNVEWRKKLRLRNGSLIHSPSLFRFFSPIPWHSLRGNASRIQSSRAPKGPCCFSYPWNGEGKQNSVPKNWMDTGRLLLQWKCMRSDEIFDSFRWNRVGKRAWRFFY